ncbi:MAG: hypothetical protein M3065_19775 [Actinomycetota bacterium]|nr:hypothetical protein [Actinomycetota bacterium]
MVLRASALVGTSVLAILSATLVTSAGAGLRDGRIVGHVRECNAPTTCVVQPFAVSASDGRGAIVAHTTTTGHNYFSLRLAAHHYALTARSAGGLTCEAAATAVAGETVHQTITCLVP